jgi:alkylation response protein AidB-like acyl-CoA dehydrogenase
MKAALAAAWLLAAAWTVPAVAQFSPAALAARLKPGMSISQVLLALGYRPTSTDETSCRQPDGALFACRVWNYATEFEQLQIFYRYNEPRQEWLVYGWRR